MEGMEGFALNMSLRKRVWDLPISVGYVTHAVSLLYSIGLPVRWPAKQGDLAGEPTKVTKVTVNVQLWCRLYLQFFINVDVKGLPLEGL